MAPPKKAAVASASPDGLDVGNGWIIGPRLGAGAQAVVHELTSKDNGNDATSWACKLAPLVKPTQRGRSKAEINVSSLYKEYQLYQNHLVDVQGSMVPRLPRGSRPLAYGEAHGFRFLVLERLQESLWDALPQLQRSQVPALAQRLLEIVQEMHTRGHLLVDVKPDNLMVARGTGSIVKRLRLVDLGLMQPFGNYAGHAPETTGNSVVGTPLYASLHVHSGASVSRRDDVQALGYILADIMLHLQQLQQEQDKKFLSHLPWRNASNDDTLGQCKHAQVLDNADSEFYQALGGSTARVFYNYFQETQGYAFAQKPNYARLHELLGQLELTTAKKRTVRHSAAHKPAAGTKATASPKKLAATAKKPAAAAALGVRRSPRLAPRSSGTTHYRKSHDSSDEDFESPPKHAKTIAMDADLDDVMVDMTQEEGSPLVTARAGLQDMELRSASPDENRQPLGLRLMCMQGPGGCLDIVEGVNDTIVVGSNPTSSTKKHESVLLVKDNALGASHCKFVLTVKRKRETVVSLNVVAVKQYQTYVNDQPVNKERMAFVGNTIRSGQTVWRVGKLQPRATVPVPAESLMPAPPCRRTTRAAVVAAASMEAMAEEEEATDGYEVVPMDVDDDDGGGNQAKAKKNSMVKLVVTKGPYAGNEYFLGEPPHSTSLCLGTAPSQKGDPLAFPNDSEMQANHCRLDWQSTKKIVKINVTDLKTDAGTFLNQKRIPRGKGQMAFANNEISIGKTVFRIVRL